MGLPGVEIRCLRSVFIQYMYDMLPSYRKPLWLRALEPRLKRRRLTHREVVETSVAHFAHIPLVFEHGSGAVSSRASAL